MARIGHNVPLKAYDHIADLLKNSAGPDGLISRDDAKALVAELRKDGRGTEALAAENLFKMIDHFDNKEGARVTGFDLNLSRKFVENKMLENRDVNHNGYSQAEIGKMSPTARALMELGQVLGMDAKPGRVAYSTPEAGMDHIANLILGSAAGDAIVSRDDQSQLSKDLYQQGRGTEALAADYFYRFMDHRDHKPGARITEEDVDKAKNYAREHLLQNKDKNQNGYSAEEIENFSTTAKAFLLVGQMIEAGLIKPE